MVYLVGDQLDHSEHPSFWATLAGSWSNLGELKSSPFRCKSATRHASGVSRAVLEIKTKDFFASSGSVPSEVSEKRTRCW